MLAMQALAEAGDKGVGRGAGVAEPGRAAGDPRRAGARVPLVPPAPGPGRSTRCCCRHRPHPVLMVNAPNNPTGWTLTRAEQQALLAHRRRTGTWIVADEVYERLWLPAGSAGRFQPGAVVPSSFLDIAAPDDRVIVMHSFSKSFLMTGWRLGWMIAPPRGRWCRTSPSWSSSTPVRRCSCSAPGWRAGATRPRCRRWLRLRRCDRGPALVGAAPRRGGARPAARCTLSGSTASRICWLWPSDWCAGLARAGSGAGDLRAGGRGLVALVLCLAGSAAWPGRPSPGCRLGGP